MTNKSRGFPNHREEVIGGGRPYTKDAIGRKQQVWHIMNEAERHLCASGALSGGQHTLLNDYQAKWVVLLWPNG